MSEDGRGEFVNYVHYGKRSRALIAATNALSALCDATTPGSSEWAWAVFGDGDREWLETDQQRELHDTICAEYFSVCADLDARYGHWRQGRDD